MKRKIAAILAADVAEYSRLVAEDEEDALRRLVAAQGVFKESVATHRGRIFNTAGDAILAEFASAVDAARCALDIQERMAARNKSYPASRQIQFRIGLSIGDVVEHETDLLGDGVNIAARLQGLAPVGGLAISHWVQEQTAGKLSVTFRDIGRQTLKNIPAPVHVFVADLIPKVATAVVTPAHVDGTHASAPLRLVLVGAVVVAVAGLAFVFSRPQLPSQNVITRDAIPASAPPAAVLIAPPTATGVAPPAATGPTAVTAPTASPPALPVPVLKTAIPPPTPTLTPAPTIAVPSIGAAAPIVVPPAIVAAPPASAPASQGAVPIAPPRPVAAPAVPASTAKDQAITTRKSAQACAEVMERAQLGDISAEDRAFLRNQCR